MNVKWAAVTVLMMFTGSVASVIVYAHSTFRTNREQDKLDKLLHEEIKEFRSETREDLREIKKILRSR